LNILPTLKSADNVAERSTLSNGADDIPNIVQMRASKNIIVRIKGNKGKVPGLEPSYAQELYPSEPDVFMEEKEDEA